MQANNLQRKTKRLKSASIGRGGKRGKTSGRGTKGQNARAGNKKRPEIRDTIKKLPKLRGYFFAPIEKKKQITVNLSEIEKLFKDGEIVNRETLAEKGLVKKMFVRKSDVKILAKGQISKKLTIEKCKLSKTAKDAILKAGGEVK